MNSIDPISPEPSVSRVWLWGAAVALTALTFGLYWPGMHCPFVYDEKVFIPTDTLIPAGKVWAAMRTHLLRALPKGSFALTWLYAAEAPLAWRLTQLGLHLICCGLAGALLYLVLDGLEPRRRGGLALLGAAGVMLHPVAVEPGLYVWSRPTVLVAGFVLVETIGLTRAFRAGGHGRVGWILVGGGAFAGALISKEIGTFPAAGMLLLVLFLFRHPWRYPGLLCAALLAAIPFLLDQGHVADPLARRLQAQTITGHFWVQMAGVLRYFLLLVPIPGQYGISHLTEPPSVAGGALGLGLLLAWSAALAAALRRGLVPETLGLGFALAHFLPYLVLPSRAVVEYKAYPLLLGMGVAAVGWLSRRAERPGFKALTVAFMLVILLGAFATYGQARAWQNPRTLWAQTLAMSPRNPEALTQAAYFRYVDGDIAGSLRFLRQAVEAIHETETRSGKLPFTPFSWTYQSLGYVLYEQRQYAEAETNFLQALAYNPANVMALTDYGVMLAGQGRLADAREMLRRAEGHMVDTSDLAAVEALRQRIKDAAAGRRP